MQSLTRDGELVVPQGEYFCARRQPQSQQGFPLLGLCPRQQIVARPLVIYFSLSRPSTTDVQQAAQSQR
jgi:signal peptidase I